MWYQAVPADWEGAPQGFGVGCVESDDGLAWRRPNYGALEVCGSKRNHITDLPFSCPSVFVDSTAPASTAHGGGVRVALLDEREETIAGYSFEDCEPVVGDGDDQGAGRDYPRHPLGF